MAKTSQPLPTPARTPQLALIVAMLSVGIAIKINGGNYHPLSIALIAIAVTASLIAMLRVPIAAVESLSTRTITTIFAAAIAIELVALFSGQFVPKSVDPESKIEMYPLLRELGFEP